MKKIVSLLLLVCMLACVLPSLSLAEEGWTTLRVECFDRNIAGFDVTNCMQLRYIQENFGDPNKIKVEFVSVPRWSETEVLNTQLAGKVAPDICFTYDSNLIQQYIEMGGILPLNDLIAEYGQNLSAFLTEQVLEYGQNDVDGEKVQYFIPARRIHTARLNVFVRGDFLEKLNMAEPATTEELIAYLYAVQENKLGGETTIPWCHFLSNEYPVDSISLINDAFVDFSKVSAEDWYAMASLREALPGVKEGYRMMNKMYNDGILPESFSLGADLGNQTTAMVQGYTGMFISQVDQPWRADSAYQQELSKNVPGAYWTAVNAFTNANDGKTWHETYAANGLGIFVPAWVSEDVAAAAVKYLDWMATPENMFVLQNGVEGVNYLSVNEDGIPVQVQPIDSVPDEYKMHATDVCILSNGLNYNSDELNNKAVALGFAGYEDEVAKSYGYAYAGGFPPATFTVPIQAEIDYGQMIISKQAEFVSNVVTCSPEEFDAVYDQFLQSTMDVGGVEIVEQKREAFQNGLIRGVFPPDFITE